MPDQIYKLQPHRTMHLQGFDAFGAAASLWGASDTGFSLSGVWRDQADFAVLVLWLADDPFGHPRFSYLPDTNFTGLRLDFDIEFTGIQAFESKKFPWVDWPYLNCLKTDGTTVQTRLSTLSTTASGRTGASGTFTVTPGTGAGRVTLWYQNRAFDYSTNPTVSQSIFWSGIPTDVHSVTVGGVTYPCTEGSLGSSDIASNIAGQITASNPYCTAVNAANVVVVSLRAGVTGPIVVSSSDGSGPGTLTNVSAASIAAAINATDWIANGPVVLSAAASGNDLTITAEPGADGNMVTWYAQASGGCSVSPATVQLSGGSSDSVLWHVTVDFDALYLTDAQNIQKLWITFAAPLSNGAAFAGNEFNVTVTNWTVADTAGTRALHVAGPGSVRIQDSDHWVVQAGYWEWAPADGFAFWSQGRAIRSAYSAYETRTLTIETHCQSTHDIYIGTRLDTNCGIVEFTLDGTTTFTLDCYGASVNVRRKVFSGVAAGKHSVVISFTGGINSLSSGWYFYYDFLECAVTTVNVPDAPETRTDVGVATDFDTDNTYKLSPQRLIWNIQKLGLVGEVDHYVGVFWWNQRVRGGTFNIPSATVTFGGSWAAGDVVWLYIGTTSIGKSVFAADNSASIAAHFAYFINATLVGVWAEASGAVLTITARSTGAIWLYALTTSTPPSGRTITVAGSLNTGAAEGDWNVDPTVTPPLNRACRDWHSDYFAALHAAGMGAVVSFSQELVNPPDNPPTAVWVQRFPDGTPVTTATGFGILNSSQCAFGTPMQTYMQGVYSAMATLMSGAGLAVRLQLGEILWWFQANGSGMAFHDADTQAAAMAVLPGGRALATFSGPNSDPSINSYQDANFLRARLKSYCDAVRSAVPGASWELLWPMDVNDPDTCQLLRYVNLPTEWQTRTGSGFDTFVMEGFQYPGIDHNLDKAKRCAEYAYAELSWDTAHCRYLMGLYYSGWPWQREFLATRSTALPLVKTWAYDHFCLFGWTLPLPKPRSPIQVF
jgi:hypothetical protein